MEEDRVSHNVWDLIPKGIEYHLLNKKWDLISNEIEDLSSWETRSEYHLLFKKWYLTLKSVNLEFI